MFFLAIAQQGKKLGAVAQGKRVGLRNVSGVFVPLRTLASWSAQRFGWIQAVAQSVFS